MSYKNSQHTNDNAYYFFVWPLRHLTGWVLVFGPSTPVRVGVVTVAAAGAGVMAVWLVLVGAARRRGGNVVGWSTTTLAAAEA